MQLMKQVVLPAQYLAQRQLFHELPLTSGDTRYAHETLAGCENPFGSLPCTLFILFQVRRGPTGTGDPTPQAQPRPQPQPQPQHTLPLIPPLPLPLTPPLTPPGDDQRGLARGAPRDVGDGGRAYT